ncbi:bifunctional adenosylcobinamide kinase/adenosylcobinamide-phosphate guanylyltransferase [Swaminathania salitolerans]|uniref:Adenosylcobinamide kinase n=1 Tax=Swaminathania salitolerans TaxID=182838 RepID=A0A511BQN7_9PROT|nr:bifunctional adenosylcobinamide kinase/adenosylcobinamide-phosphate guanylyltransferase [Swaminathania salitolerans]GBQ11629.1 adenosylcobalamin biosynthesis bifunctional protein CobP [Swaminathania salitolerans LMG 21291]GEL02565.1 adenosylcobinamide kinase/adenosylcobinamide phosphate guanyltransferase [Swaminathania salitolerans]
MNCILVLGGARSGKSRHAESLVTAEPGPWRYVATGRAWDDEMRLRIDAHRSQRGTGWNTVEAPVDLVSPLQCPEPVLIDCTTLWLTNLILNEDDVASATDRLLEALFRRSALTVLVGNEVGSGIVPENALARRFRDEAGLLHQKLARHARRVLFVVAGYALDMK